MSYSNIKKASGLAHTFLIITFVLQISFVEADIIVEKLKVHVGGVALGSNKIEHYYKQRSNTGDSGVVVGNQQQQKNVLLIAVLQLTNLHM